MPKFLLRLPLSPLSNYSQEREASRKMVVPVGSIPFALLILLFFAIPWIYIANEHIIQFWDQPSYHNLALYKMLSLQEMKLSLGGIKRQLMEIYRSTGDSYSHFHTLVISPFLLMFGTSRAVYVTLLSLLYQLPFTLVLARIATMMVPVSEKKAAFWLAILIAVLTPALWLPTLNGYPDAGAAFLITLAVLLYLQDLRLSSLRRIGGISILLALAILFRRHFVYDVVVFFVVVSLHQLFAVSSLAAPIKDKAYLMARSAVRVGLIGILLVVTLALIGWPFLERLIYTNYRYLYTSYERSTIVNISSFLSYYGWIFVLAALGGLIVSLTRSGKALSRPIAAFVLMFGVLSVLQWVFTVRQIGFHYSTHFTPWIILGLFTAAWQVRQRLKKNKMATSVLAGAAAVLFLVNITNALTWVKAGSTAADEAGWESTASIFLRPMAGKFAPTVRTDYDSLLSLTRYLHEIASPQDGIYVAASSEVLNDDLIWHVNRFLYEDVREMKAKDFYKSKTLNVLHWIPFTDSGDPYPLEKLIESEIVLTTTPVQLNLPDGEQQVLTVVVDAFQENWLFARDFALLPRTITLEKNTQVHIYKRLRPTSLQTALVTLDQMITYHNRRPGAQLDWLMYNPTGVENYVQIEKDGTYTLSLKAKEGDQPTWICVESGDSVAKIAGRLEFSEPVQGPFTLRAEKVNRMGEVLESVEKTGTSTDSAFDLSFSKPLAGSFLVLHLTLPQMASDAEPAWVLVKNLAVSAAE